MTSKVIAKYCLQFVDQTLFVRSLVIIVYLVIADFKCFKSEREFLLKIIQIKVRLCCTNLLKRKLLQLIDLILSHIVWKIVCFFHAR